MPDTDNAPAVIPSPERPMCPECDWHPLDKPTRKLCFYCRLARRPKSRSHRRLQGPADPYKRRYIKVHMPFCIGDRITYMLLPKIISYPRVVFWRSRYWLIGGPHAGGEGAALVLAMSTPEASSFESSQVAFDLAQKLAHEGFQVAGDSEPWLGWELFSSDPDGLFHVLSTNPAIARCMAAFFIAATADDNKLREANS